MVKSDYKTALKWGEKSLVQAEKEYGKMDTNYCATLEKISVLFYYQGKPDSAVCYGEKCLELSRKLYSGNQPKLLDIINNLASFYYENSNYFLAEPLYLEGLNIARKLYKTNDPNLAQMISNVGAFYSRISKYKEAEPLLNEALEMRRQLFNGDHNDMAQGINNMAYFYNTIGDYNRAEILFTESLEMRRRLFKGDNNDLATSINNLAELFCKKCDFKSAEPLYIESLEMKRNIFKGNHNELASCINNTGKFYENIGNKKKAEILYKESLEMRRQLFKKGHVDLAKSISSLANFYLSSGDTINSEPLFLEALEMNRHLYDKNHPDLANSINNLAIFYKTVSKFEQAEALYNESLAMNRSIFKGDNTDVANILNNLALLYEAKSDYKNAEKFYIEALDMYRHLYNKNHPDLANCVNNLALLYDKIGEYQQSETLQNETFIIIENIIKDYFPSLSESEKEMFFSTLNSYYYLYHSVIFNLNNYNNKELDSNFHNTLKQEYNNLLFSKGILLNSTSKVRNQIMNSKDSSLIDLFNTLRDKRIYISKLYSMTNQQLAKKYINFDSVLNSANDIEKELTKKSDAFAKENDKKIYKWQDVQNSLGKDEAAIEMVRFYYFDIKNNRLTDSIIYSAVILKHFSDDFKSSDESNKSPDFVLLENGNELEEKYFAKYSKIIRDLGEEYRNGSKMWTDNYIKNSLKDMYVNFWQKIQEKLVGVKTVYLSVDGVYNKINLNTLINPETGKYLAEELDLRIVTSTRYMVNRNIIADNILSGNNTAELFGSPKFNLDSNEIKDIAQKYAVNKQNYENNNSNNKLTRSLGDTLLRGLSYDELPGTKIEIEKISEILKSKGWTANINTGIDATEEVVKSVNSPKILHIATHGQFDKNNETSEEQKKIYENPLFKSKLILAGGENTRLKLGNNESIDSGTEDGYLTAYEVMNMNLDNTELVVLSACETGLGEIRNGEGVYGLQRAFQVAGAKSLIMSLWKVPDAPTQELMLSFYSKWLGGMDKREAFRQSQMELAKNYPNFFYWGAFEIITNY
jgi:CHAT domain-containing protein/Flp pilus assembly protein TadD